MKRQKGFYETIRIRLPTRLLEDIKKVADRCDVDFEDLIKLYLYDAVHCEYGGRDKKELKSEV